MKVNGNLNWMVIWAIALSSAITVCSRAQEAAESGTDAIWMTDRLGAALVKSDGTEVDSGTLKGKTVALYFSAHWCPPCKMFSPKLVKAYNEMKEAGKPFEIVLVSSDRNETAMYNYMKELEMPWLAVPYTDARREKLGRDYKVRGIPTLVILDENGKTITTNGRGDIMQAGGKAFDRWNKE